MRAIDATVDFDPVVLPAGAESSLADAGLSGDAAQSGTGSQTGTGSQSGEMGKPDTVAERRFAATVDLGSPPPVMAERMSLAWGSHLESDENPHHTIKGSEPPGGSPSATLVIKPRALRRPNDQTPTLADYELLEVLGSGGMGVVYAARQASIDRTVAVKMLKPNVAADEAQRAKFLSEAVVTGDLDHPNIVPMYDLGSNQDGALFYAMKRVQGTPWSKAIDRKDLADNLDTLLKVADAVAFAHSRGIIHRDLKPENVMLGEFGEVLVMDWGLAYSTTAFRKSETVMQSSTMGGTPAYMAPEMATGPLERVGPLSDIYLLSAILFEILTGMPPHAGKNVTQCLFAAAGNIIRPHEVRSELMDIALRGMATVPEERYLCVRDFQAAIRGYLSHAESVKLQVHGEIDLLEAEQTRDYATFSRALFGFQEALSLWPGNEKAAAGQRRALLAYATSALGKGDYDLAGSLLVSKEAPSGDAEFVALGEQVSAAVAERAARLQRLRNTKRLVVAMALAMVMLVVVAYLKISSERDRALAAEEEALVERDRAHQAKEAEEYESYVARVGLAAARIEENAFDGALSLLGECKPPLRYWEWGRLRYLCGQSYATYQAAAPVSSVAYDPHARRFATGGWDGLLRVWDFESGQQLHALPHAGAAVHAVAFSPDGKLLASGSADPAGYVRLWDAESGRPVASLPGHTEPVLSVCFSADGAWLLTTSYDHTARLWEVVSGKQLGVMHGHSWWVWDGAFSPDGERIVTVGQDAKAIVWRVDEVLARGTGNSEILTEQRFFTAHTGPVYRVAFAPDGQQVATAGHDQRVLLWDARRVEPFDYQALFASDATLPQVPHRVLSGHTGAISALAFAPSGQRLASGAHDNTIRLWDVTQAEPLERLRGHAGQVRSLAFLPDGQWLLSGSHDATARLWDLAGYAEVRTLGQRLLSGHSDAVLAAAFHPQGIAVATASRDRSARSYALPTGEPLQVYEEGHAFLAASVGFFPDGSRLLTTAGDGTLRLWDVAAGTQLATLEGLAPSGTAAIAPSGEQLATADEDQRVSLWDADTLERTGQLPPQRSEITALAYSPSGQLLAVGEASGRVSLWHVERGELAWSQANHSRKITALAFATAERLLSASADNTVGQWDTTSGQELVARTLKHPDAVLSLALLPGGEQALTSCADGLVRRWQLDAAEPQETLALPKDSSLHLATSTDGKYLLAASATRRGVWLWDVMAGRPLLPSGQRGTRQSNARQSGTGDAAREQPWLDLRQQGALVWAAVFSPDGASVATVGGNSAKLWYRDSAVQRQSFGPHGAVAAVAYSPDGQRLATGSWDGMAKIWDTTTGRALKQLSGGHSAFVNSAAFSPDGALLLTAGDDHRALLWSIDQGDIVREFAGHTDRVSSAQFSTDGARVLTTCGDRLARIYRTDDGSLLKELRGHEWAILGGAFSPDGQWVATASADNTAALWSAESGSLLRRLQGHTAAVTSVAFSLDGRRVATGSQDNTVKIWDTANAQELLTLKGHTQEVASVSFSPCGLMLLSASRDGTAIVWLADDWREPPSVDAAPAVEVAQD